MQNKLIESWKSLLLACAGLFLMSAGLANAAEWPQELTGEGGTVVVYQPQPEAIEGTTLTGRAAMSIELDGGEAPIYGVLWFAATIETDRSEDSVSLSDLRITEVNWPDSKDTGEQRFTQVVEQRLEGSVFEASLSELSASLAVSDKVKQSLEEINNDPPDIQFSQTLAVLLMFDGKPYFKAVENGPFERALNTALVVVRDTRNDE